MGTKTQTDPTGLKNAWVSSRLRVHTGPQVIFVAFESPCDKLRASVRMVVAAACVPSLHHIILKKLNEKIHWQTGCFYWSGLRSPSGEVRGAQVERAVDYVEGRSQLVARHWCRNWGSKVGSGSAMTCLK